MYKYRSKRKCPNKQTAVVIPEDRDLLERSATVFLQVLPLVAEPDPHCLLIKPHLLRDEGQLLTGGTWLAIKLHI